MGAEENVFSHRISIWKMLALLLLLARLLSIGIVVSEVEIATLIANKLRSLFSLLSFSLLAFYLFNLLFASLSNN